MSFPIGILGGHVPLIPPQLPPELGVRVLAKVWVAVRVKVLLYTHRVFIQCKRTRVKICRGLSYKQVQTSIFSDSA